MYTVDVLDGSELEKASGSSIRISRERSRVERSSWVPRRDRWITRTRRFFDSRACSETRVLRHWEFGVAMGDQQARGHRAMEPRFFRSQSAFRAWLTKHHAVTSELLVGFYK